ncbi:MAG: hypothetical protein IJS60_04220 [Abditibacteriota bacterium]|nr:hypothetical protein [Abditibacteriota bacterium]
MKKILFFLLFFFCITSAYCNTYEFDTKNINITFKNEDKLLYISSILNKNTNTECIESNIGAKRNIWFFQVKKNKEYSSAPIDMLPGDANNFKVSKSYNKIVFTWLDVKKEDWNKGFDVIVTGEKSGLETLWHIKIISKTEEYGIWQINFPNIVFRFRTGDTWFSGLFGGNIETVNDPNTRPGGHGLVKLPWVPYPVGDMPMQFMTDTQNGSGIYICPEDIDGWHKHFKFPSLNDKEIDYSLEVYPNNQGVGGLSYSQAFKFNICAFDGDYYDAIKKYRAWGIKNGAAPFKRGLIKDRKDFPEWVKKNVFWGNDYQTSVAGNVPSAFHLYVWWHLPHDVGYPEMLPAKEDFINEMLNNNPNHNFVFYTNCHLIDTKNSPLYQKYGDKVVNLEENLEAKKFHWGQEYTINSAACPSLDVVKDISVNLNKHLISKYSADGVYLDEITMIEPEPCFNEEHGHSLGTGNRWVKEYSNLMERIMKECGEVSDKPIIIFSEGTAEPYPCDMELDLQPNPDKPYGKSLYTSGYRIYWGMQYNAYDFEPSQNPGIAKLAWTLIGGWQLGWYEFLPEGKDYSNYPDFTFYQKNACLARNHAIDYFSLGEMVRNVNITSEMPYIDTTLELVANSESPIKHIPGIQTSSWNLDEKTMIVFTNITKDTHIVKWETTPNALNLKNEILYKITEEYPIHKDLGKGYNKIKSEFVINPLDTVIIIIKE